MFNALYTFFYSTIFDNNGTLLSSTFDIFNTNITLRAYLCTLGSLISVIFILVLCCLFVYKIIKLIAGLVR